MPLVRFLLIVFRFDVLDFRVDTAGVSRFVGEEEFNGVDSFVADTSGARKGKCCEAFEGSPPKE